MLGAILTVSAASGTAVDGVALLSIGRIGWILQVIAAGIMILMGIAMITGQLSAFAFWLLETFPVLGQIG